MLYHLMDASGTCEVIKNLKRDFHLFNRQRKESIVLIRTIEHLQKLFTIQRNLYNEVPDDMCIKMASSDLDGQGDMDKKNDGNYRNNDELQQTYQNIQPSGYLRPKSFEQSNYLISAHDNMTHLISNGVSTGEGISTNNSRSPSRCHSVDSNEARANNVVETTGDLKGIDEQGEGVDAIQGVVSDDEGSSVQRQFNNMHMRGTQANGYNGFVQRYGYFEGISNPLNSMQRYYMGTAYGYMDYGPSMPYENPNGYYSKPCERPFDAYSAYQKSISTYAPEEPTSESLQQRLHKSSVSYKAKAPPSDAANQQPSQYSSLPSQPHGSAQQSASFDNTRPHVQVPPMYNAANGFYYSNTGSCANGPIPPYNTMCYQGYQAVPHIGTRPFPYGVPNVFTPTPAPTPAAVFEPIPMMAPVGMQQNQAMPYRNLPYIPRPIVIRSSQDPRWVERMQESQRPNYNGQLDGQNGGCNDNDLFTNKRLRSSDGNYDEMVVGSATIASASNESTRTHTGAGRPKMNRKDYYCTKCNVRHTPQWRYFFHEPVCNACYMKLKKQFNLSSTTTKNNKRQRK